MAGDSRSVDSAKKLARWSSVPMVVSIGALFFGLAWGSIALTTLSSGDGAIAESLAVAAGLAAALTVVVGAVWGLTRASQWRLDRKESPWLARHPGLTQASLDQLSVDPSEGEVSRCEIDGRSREYHRSHGQGYSTAHTLEIRSEGRSLLTATSALDPQVLGAKVMRSGLEGTVLDIPLAMRLRRRGLLRRHRRIDITVGDRALSYTWGRSRPVLIRGVDRSDVIMRATSGHAYELLRPVSEHEHLVAATLALGSAKDAIRSPVWGFFAAIFDGI